MNHDLIKMPKMIFFDYGQTLINELYFDGVKGTEAVLKYTIKNKYGKTAVEIQKEAEELNREFGRFDMKKIHEFQFEIHNYPFQNYLYESMGIELSISNAEIETVFWDHAAPGVPTEGIEDILAFLHKNHIRTGVISNISFSGNALRNRITQLLPNNHFECILASSDYIFRKPNKRIFELALQKAECKPEEVWFCGDQFQCDIIGSKNCGMQPVWYTGSLHFEQEAVLDDYIKIEKWSELETIIKNQLERITGNHERF